MKELNMSKLATIIFLLTVIVFFSCSASYKLCQQAKDCEIGGDYTAAANYYYRSLLDDKTNSEALIGLKTNAPKVFIDKMTQFRSYYNKRNYQNAFNEYNKANDYRKKISDFGVIVILSDDDINELATKNWTPS